MGTFTKDVRNRLSTIVQGEDDQSVYSSTTEGSADLSEIIPHVSMSTKRLQERSAFLASLIKQVTECTAQVNRLNDGHKYAVAKNLRESDLIYERANLSNKVR